MRFAQMCLCAVLLLVYWPGLRGPFVFDDFPTVVKNQAIVKAEWSLPKFGEAAWSGESGPLKRPVAYISFALDALFADNPSDTLPFKLTNLLIHVGNSFLVYALAMRLLRITARRKHGRTSMVSDEWIAITAAALWALHPMQLTTVLYVAQRMTSLATAFVLAGTITFLTGRERLEQQRNNAWALIWAGLAIGLLGLSAKENAAVLPLLFLAIEYTMYSESARDATRRKQLRRFYGTIVGLPLLALVVGVSLNPDFISDGYAGRDFTPIQRLLTEARILWFYLGLLAIPDPRQLTLFHDDFVPSQGLIEPWTTLIAVVALALAVVIAIRIRQRQPLVALSILWFFIGHGIESSIIGLELVHEHRNYLPDIVLFVAAAYALPQIVSQRRFAVAVCFALIFVYAGATWLRAQTWSREDLLIESMVRHHPNSARSQAMMGELLAYRANALPEALVHYRRAAALAPTDAGYLVQMLMAGRAHAPNASSAAPAINDVSADIAHRLATGFPNPAALAQIDAVAECIAKTPERCSDLYEHVLRWCDTLLDNPRVTASVRRLALDHTLYLTMPRHDYLSALDAVTRARKSEPDNVTYLIQEVDLQVRIGNLARAEDLISTLETKSLTSETVAKVNTLRLAISARRETRGR